ncbi:ABC transporter substrate-binding protein [Nocardioides sp. NPDC051685]|uniref:ABC transporter substrate-binding protein n=1 Tax=Nocardioides sp. NPDC051685 TaxID=3364334 RepID=UPI0037AC7927
MTRWKTTLGSLIAVATAAAALAACGGGASEDKTGGSGPDKVDVGVIPIVDVAPIYLGKDKGFFKDEDIDLSLETGQGGAAIVPGVASGQFQFGFSNLTSLMVASEQGLGVKVVAAGNSTTGEVGKDFGAVVVPGDSTIADAAALEGKSVAVNTLNNIGSTTINKAVRDAGGDPTKVKYVELAFPDMPGALANGQVDAAWVVEPFLTITKGQGAKPVVWNFAETDPNLMIAAYFTSPKVLAEDPDLVKRFTAALNKSLDYAQDNPDEARAIIQTYTELDADAAAKITLPKWSSTIDENSFTVLGDLAVTDGALKSKPDIGALLQ